MLGGQPDPASDSASAELFDPTAGTFKATGDMMFAQSMQAWFAS